MARTDFIATGTIWEQKKCAVQNVDLEVGLLWAAIGFKGTFKLEIVVNTCRLCPDTHLEPPPSSNHESRKKLYFSVRLCVCTVGQKKIIPIFLNTNYRTEIKLVPVIKDYCLLQFDALKFFLGVRLHRGWSWPNFNFFIINPQIFQRNREVHLSNCLETNFHNISNNSLRIIRRRNYS